MCKTHQIKFLFVIFFFLGVWIWWVSVVERKSLSKRKWKERRKTNQSCPMPFHWLPFWASKLWLTISVLSPRSSLFIYNFRLSDSCLLLLSFLFFFLGIFFLDYILMGCMWNIRSGFWLIKHYFPWFFGFVCQYIQAEDFFLNKKIVYFYYYFAWFSFLYRMILLCTEWKCSFFLAEKYRIWILFASICKIFINTHVIYIHVISFL